MTCAGDVPTLETLAMVSILKQKLSNQKVRVVNRSDKPIQLFNNYIE